uniref:Uncharacterized protein n=1 Tax=Timema monikensis TaxID=170555 RepID=A0A7R9HK49_9NEOP|nr:unnamed protein product [Timema monikensis]
MICKNMCLAAVTSDSQDLGIYLNVDCQKSAVNCKSAPKKSWDYCIKLKLAMQAASPSMGCQRLGKKGCGDGGGRVGEQFMHRGSRVVRRQTAIRRSCLLTLSRYTTPTLLPQGRKLHEVFSRLTTYRSQQSSASDERKVTCQKTDAFLPPHQKALRFVSSVELRHSSGETSTTPLSPSSPADDSSGEMGGNQANKPRLQRSKAQSRKTFRLRKSRKSHIQVSHIKVEPQELPTVGGQQPPAQQPVMELSVSGIPTPRAHRFSTRQTRSADSKLPESSWDEVSQTSSTSGYHESYSLLMMTLESPPTPAAAPPLASPDIHDLPSTSSATPNYVVAEGSSPDSSINSTGGEDTALLCRNERTSSQHSLLMVFETEDENTLI